MVISFSFRKWNESVSRSHPRPQRLVGCDCCSSWSAWIVIRRFHCLDQFHPSMLLLLPLLLLVVLMVLRTMTATSPHYPLQSCHVRLSCHSTTASVPVGYCFRLRDHHPLPPRHHPCDSYSVRIHPTSSGLFLCYTTRMHWQVVRSKQTTWRLILNKRYIS